MKIVKTMHDGNTNFIGHMCETHIEEAKGKGEVFLLGDSDNACDVCDPSNVFRCREDDFVLQTEGGRFWCGKGKITGDISRAKSYESWQRANMARLRIKDIDVKPITIGNYYDRKLAELAISPVVQL